jgi:hypothetical protein
LVLDALEAIFILSSAGDNYSDFQEQIRHQIFLGRDVLVPEYQQAIEKSEKLREVSNVHKRLITLILFPGLPGAGRIVSEARRNLISKTLGRKHGI